MYYCVLLLKKKIHVFVGKISLFKPLLVQFFGKCGGNKVFLFLLVAQKKEGKVFQEDGPN